MLVCRVVLGNPVSVDRGDAAQGPAALAAGTHDSVLCDLEAQRGTFREFIAFDEAQVHRILMKYFKDSKQYSKINAIGEVRHI